MANKKKRRVIPAGDRKRYLVRRMAEGTATEAELSEYEKMIVKEPETGNLDAVFSDDAQPANSISQEAAPPADVSPEPEQVELPIEAAPPVAAPVVPPPPPAPHRLKSFAGKLPSPGAGVRIDHKPASKVAADDWRAPYLTALKGAGREASVLFIAGQAMGLLKGMSDSIKSVGIKPIVDIEDNAFKAALVLTVDDYLPANMVVKPVHMTVVGSAGLTVQTFVHRKAIAAEQQKVKDRTDMRRRREATAEEQTNAESVVTPQPPQSPDVPGHAVSVAADSVNGVSPGGIGAMDGAGHGEGNPSIAIPGIALSSVTGPTIFDPNDIH
jgi:hypothetical protein